MADLTQMEEILKYIPHDKQSWFHVEVTLSSIFSVSCTNKSDRIYGKLLPSYLMLLNLDQSNHKKSCVKSCPQNLIS